MATLSQGPRLNARTTRRIHGLVKQLGIACSSQGLTFQGRDISSEAIISAVLEDVAIIKGHQPPPRFGSIKPVGEKPKVVYDVFTGMPIEEQAPAPVERPRLDIENPYAKKLFKRLE